MSETHEVLHEFEGQPDAAESSVTSPRDPDSERFAREGDRSTERALRIGAEAEKIATLRASLAPQSTDRGDDFAKRLHAAETVERNGMFVVSPQSDGTAYLWIQADVLQKTGVERMNKAFESVFKYNPQMGESALREEGYPSKPEYKGGLQIPEGYTRDELEQFFDTVNAAGSVSARVVDRFKRILRIG